MTSEYNAWNRLAKEVLDPLGFKNVGLPRPFPPAPDGCFPATWFPGGYRPNAPVPAEIHRLFEEAVLATEGARSLAFLETRLRGRGTVGQPPKPHELEDLRVIRNLGLLEPEAARVLAVLELEPAPLSPATATLLANAVAEVKNRSPAAYARAARSLEWWIETARVVNDHVALKCAEKTRAVLCSCRPELKSALAALTRHLSLQIQLETAPLWGTRTP